MTGYSNNSLKNEIIIKLNIIKRNEKINSLILAEINNTMDILFDLCNYYTDVVAFS